MTSAEAIEKLKWLLDCNYVDSFEDEENEAIKLGIKALNVLDKIMNEIEEDRKGYPPSAAEYKTINKILRIITNIMEESEG